MDAPASVPVGESFNYVATLDFEGPATTHSGVVLTTTLDEGTVFESCPIGGDSPITTCTYDDDTRVLTMTLGDTQTDPLSVAYTVRQEPYNDRYEGEVFSTSVTGVGGSSCPVTSNTVDTVLTGSNDYRAGKNFQALTGSDNRTVTYTFNVGVGGPQPGTFASHAQELTDTFPAGVEFVSSSASIGAWDVTAFPTVVWTNDSIYYSNLQLDPSGSSISVTVRYPEAGFPGLVPPPVNTVQSRTQDANGVWHDGQPASAQSVPFAVGVVPGVAAAKAQVAGSDSAGFLQHVVSVKGSYVGPADSPDVDSLTLEDSGATGTANAPWYQHLDIQNVGVEFTGILAAENLDYTFEYQANGSASWQSVTPPSGTGSRTTFLTHVAGSEGWGQGAAIDLAPGETISGWRIVVAPGAETVPIDSEVQVTLGGQPVFRTIAEGVVDASATAGAEVGPVDNTVTVRNGDGSLNDTASYTFTPRDSVYLTTTIEGPASLSVGGSGSYRASIINQNPSDTYFDSVMTVVLPCGILHDEAEPFVPDTTPLVGVPAPAPAVGSGVTVDTTGRIADENGCARQVIRFTFDEVPPMRAPGTANHRLVERDGWSYDIPVTVLAEAYHPDNTSVLPTSWSHTNDPRFIAVADGGSGAATVPMLGYGPFFNPDALGLDPVRDSIGYSDVRTTINTAGGVLIDKLSSASADGPFALTSPVEDAAYWRIFVSNVLPNAVSNAVFFDRLPNTADGDDFSVVLAGPVAGVPAGSTVEYSTDATSATSGSWSSDAAGAVAFRINVPSVARGGTFTLIVPTAVEGHAVATQTADNQVSATATYNGVPVAFESNDAAVTIAPAPGISIVKTVNGIDVPSVEEAPVVPEGGAVQWRYVVTNTGTTTLTSVTVADLGGPRGAPATSLDLVAPVGFDGRL
jgi:hypothetical protein